ncbi:MAG: ABC transporter ATP-binding protein [Propionibacteriaceae bacterium]|jgi:putative ABC transport system ATP-binding protein|nr:ABC transporter ATP-binding protein [Propionibacteriaceae bacterium]
MSILELNDVSYSYDGLKCVLTDLTWGFEESRLYAVTGRSGAGKTTLLSLLAGLTNPTGGAVLFNGHDLATLDRYRYRSHDVGVVFQSFNLLPHLTAVENVELGMRASGKRIDHRRDHAMALLDKVGLDESLATRRVLKLSGGEQQRVAIARALSYDPKVILADEPTGNLDLATQNDIVSMLGDLADEGKCVIVVTHSPEVVDCVDEVYRLKAEAVKPKKTRRRNQTAIEGSSGQPSDVES